MINIFIELMKNKYYLKNFSIRCSIFIKIYLLEFFMIEWTDDLLLGIDIVDEQHKSIFDQATRLLDAFEEGTEKAESFDALDFLENYAKKHFSTEEFYLKKYGFNKLDAHIAQHRNFCVKLENFKFNHRKGGLTRAAAMELRDFLLNWL